MDWNFNFTWCLLNSEFQSWPSSWNPESYSQHHIWHLHLKYQWASLVAQTVKNLPALWETWVQSLGWEDPLEKGTAPLQHSGLENSMDRSLAGYSSCSLKGSDRTERLSLSPRIPCPWQNSCFLSLHSLPQNSFSASHLHSSFSHHTLHHLSLSSSCLLSVPVDATVLST